MKFKKAEEGAFYNFNLKNGTRGEIESFRCEIISKSPKHPLTRSSSKRAPENRLSFVEPRIYPAERP